MAVRYRVSFRPSLFDIESKIKVPIIPKLKILQLELFKFLTNYVACLLTISWPQSKRFPQ